MNLLEEREVGYYLGDSGAALLLAWHEFADAAHLGAEHAGTGWVLVEPGDFELLLGRCDAVRDTVERAAADTAVILYTSGTTGEPKGAELTHWNMLEREFSAERLSGTRARRQWPRGPPLFHSFGQTARSTRRCVGGELTQLERFEPGAALKMIQRDRVTLFAGVPTMYAALLHVRRGRGQTCRALEPCVCGGAAMPVDLLHAFDQRFGSRSSRATGSRRHPRSPPSTRDRDASPAPLGCP